jgi:hypothetical protein
MCFAGAQNSPQQMQAGLTAQMAGGIMQSLAEQRQGQQTSNFYNYMAQQQNNQAMSERQQGISQAVSYDRNAQQFRGSQIAAMAANGVDGSSVSAQNVIGDTAAKQKLDEDTILYNANLRAQANNNQAAVYQAGAKNAASAGNSKAFGSLIGSSGAINNTWNLWKKTSQGIANPSQSITAGGISGIAGQY